MSIAATCPHCGRRYTLTDAMAGKRGKCKTCGQGFTVPNPHVEVSERTSGGVPVYRPGPRKQDPESGIAYSPYINQIQRHIEKTIGPAPSVFHELISGDVHVDLHIVPPTHAGESEDHPLRMNHYTIITSGLSARPMNVPPKSKISPYAELMIALPEDWPGMQPDGSFDQDMMKDERNWWPIRWLKQMARLPHEYNTYLGYGVTVPNGENADPYAKNTKLGCMMAFTTVLSPKAKALQINDQITIHFFSLWPLYPEEMNLKLEKGLEPLVEKFIEADMTELIRPDRPNVCKKRGGSGDSTRLRAAQMRSFRRSGPRSK